ncbi:MAG: LysE family translocator [Hyphomicrobiales bacterium]|nr:LysE family translocator [Hyphomicrobiales bacterium]
MTLTDILTYVVVAALAMATPGPGIAALVARALVTGFRGAAPMIGGYVIGDLFYLSLAVFGLAVIAQAFGAVFIVLKYVGVAYLIFLAIKFWRMPVHEEDLTAPRKAGYRTLFLAGLSVTLGNPKVMVFYLAVLPAVIDLGTVSAADYAVLAAITSTVLTSVLSAYAFLAGRARELFRAPRARRRLNRTAGTVMAGAALAVATR